MTEPDTELLLRVNGIQAAFGIEFGLSSPRADEGRTAPYRQANTSYSLIQLRAGKPIRHTLIDVGMGVVPSLLELEASHDIHVVHELLITHPHFDHFAQADWLSMNLLRSRRDDQPRPLPIYASQTCWEIGPNTTFRYLAERSHFRPIEDGDCLVLDDVTITPFSVDHGPKAPGALGFVVEHGNRKITLTGDFLNIPGENNELFFDADVCFLDANTWHPTDWTGHQSVLGNLRLINKWRPRRTYLIHYSGYEDLERSDDPVHGPLTLTELGQQVRNIACERDIQPAQHGMILGDTVDWP